MYRYEVNFWDEDTHEPTCEKGITHGKDYGDAVNHVVDYYGQTNIIDIKIYELEDLILDEEIEEMFKE